MATLTEQVQAAMEDTETARDTLRAATERLRYLLDLRDRLDRVRESCDNGALLDRPAREDLPIR